MPPLLQRSLPSLSGCVVLSEILSAFGSILNPTRENVQTGVGRISINKAKTLCNIPLISESKTESPPNK